MSKITFNKAQKDHLVQALQQYFSSELAQELGQFDAEFLLDFISEKLGGYYYNQGLYDAQAMLQSRFDNLSDAIFDLEQSTELSR
jgi:uncharacterized protein (DUF2164 family)